MDTPLSIANHPRTLQAFVVRRFWPERPIGAQWLRGELYELRRVHVETDAGDLAVRYAWFDDQDRRVSKPYRSTSMADVHFGDFYSAHEALP
jgi:hypothetical protein